MELFSVKFKIGLVEIEVRRTRLHEAVNKEWIAKIVGTPDFWRAPDLEGMVHILMNQAGEEAAPLRRQWLMGILEKL